MATTNNTAMMTVASDAFENISNRCLSAPTFGAAEAKS
jgi:hypothetical protein